MEISRKTCYNILICATGSVAAIKLPLLIENISTKALEKKCDIVIRVCMTANSLHFCHAKNLSNICDKVYLDDDEWSAWQGRGDPVLHIELTKWADIILIAPLDANSLAKIASGICDNLVLCCVRAWDISKPLLYCPAMNTKMWSHPITAKQIDLLCSWGYTHLEPISKTLMCGDTGVGAMMEPHDIADRVITRLIP